MKGEASGSGSGSSLPKNSRILAALDQGYQASFIPTPPSAYALQTDLGTKRKRSGTLEALTRPSGEQKRRMSGDYESDGDEDGEFDPYLSRSSSSSSPAPSRIQVLRGSQMAFQLNYDKETPLRSIDVGGHDQAEKMAEFVSNAIENLSDGVTVKDAIEGLGLQSKTDYLPGLEVRLLGHQLIGVNWMLQHERERPQKGGILADDMGLGKTIQMIALMTINQPTLDDTDRTNLVVVPAALLQQWKEEIETRTNDIFDVHIHHGKDKLKKVEDVKSKDVVITTYQTLNSDFYIPPDVEPADEISYVQNHGGVLARSKFYRVVLDEAQYVRNRGTRSSRSVAMLRSKYRWMLTGTPITNTLADLYGLLRFGRFRPWNDWEDFNQYICKAQSTDAVLAGNRAQEILKPLLLRRTKDGKLDGKPLLELEPKHVDVVKLDFSPEERQLYDQLEKRAAVTVNKFIRMGTLLKNHAAVLTIILRLRQICGHPHLILAQSDGFDDPSLIVASESDKELARVKRVMGSGWVASVQKRFLDSAVSTALMDFDDDDNEDEMTCPVCNDFFIHDSGRILGCGHGICFECLMDMRHNPPAHNGIFGEGSEQENLQKEKAFEAAATKGYRPCPKCSVMIDPTDNKVFKASAFEPKDVEVSRAVQNARLARKKKKQEITSFISTNSRRMIVDDGEDEDDEVDLSDDSGLEEITRDIPSPTMTSNDSSDDEFPDPSQLTAYRKKGSPQKAGPSKMSSRNVTSKNDSDSESNTKAPDDGPSAEVVRTWRNNGIDLEPSTKMLGLMDFIREWESTGDKIVVFSQWTTMLDLVEKFLLRYALRWLRYDGSMDQRSREVSLSTFKKPGGPRIMLISTKCGGVGLNLVSANRIVNLDLSWNYAAESQAYDRCHRIGQSKEVYIKRLVVRDTIEDRMLQLQDVKTGLAEAALGEGQGAKLNKLSVKDIKLLFGMTKDRDEDL